MTHSSMTSEGTLSAGQVPKVRSRFHYILEYNLGFMVQELAGQVTVKCNLMEATRRGHYLEDMPAVLGETLE